MLQHTRALLAASAFAFSARKKVAGVYDHAEGRHLRIAAESRADSLQGFDGDRDARFGGTLPELRDAGDGASISMEIDGARGRGYDRSSSSHFTVEITERLVQLYDHGSGRWFAFGMQVA